MGACLAAQNIEVIYGGSRYGCMGKLADAVVQTGGKLTAIVPKFFTGISPYTMAWWCLIDLFNCVVMEGYSSAVDEIVVPDMHTRKKMFFDRVSYCEYILCECVCVCVCVIG